MSISTWLTYPIPWFLCFLICFTLLHPHYQSHMLNTIITRNYSTIPDHWKKAWDSLIKLFQLEHSPIPTGTFSCLLGDSSYYQASALLFLSSFISILDPMTYHSCYDLNSLSYIINWAKPQPWVKKIFICSLLSCSSLLLVNALV